MKWQVVVKVLLIVATFAAVDPLPHAQVDQSTDGSAHLFQQDRSTVIQQCAIPGYFALTIDDGTSGYSQAILDALLETGIKATFFYIGDNLLEANGFASAQRALAEGHQVAQHDLDHTSFLSLTDADIERRMVVNDAIFRQAIGKVPTFFRFPYFEYGLAQSEKLGQMGYVLVDRNLETSDWQVLNAAATVELVSDTIAAQSPYASWITLLHENGEIVETIRALADVVRNSGYQFVTISECIGDQEAAYKD